MWGVGKAEGTEAFLCIGFAMLKEDGCSVGEMFNVD